MLAEIVKAAVFLTPPVQSLHREVPQVGLCPAADNLLKTKDLAPKVKISPKTIEKIKGFPLTIVATHGEQDSDQINQLAAASYCQRTDIHVLIDNVAMGVLSIPPDPSVLPIYDVDYRKLPEEKIPAGRRVRLLDHQIDTAFKRLILRKRSTTPSQLNRPSLKRAKDHLDNNGAIMVFPDAGHSSHHWDNFDALIRRSKYILLIATEPGTKKIRYLVLPYGEKLIPPQERHPRIQISHPIYADRLGSSPTDSLHDIYVNWTNALRKNNYYRISINNFADSQVLAF